MQKFSDAARGYLSAGISDSDTTITISDGGAAYPVANTGSADISGAADWFKAVLQDTSGIEIVYVRTHTSGSNSFANVLRGREGTTARSFAAGSVFGVRVTASDMAFRDGDGIQTATLTQRNRIDANWTIPSGYNALSIGPVEIAPDVTVTGLGNSEWRGI